MSGHSKWAPTHRQKEATDKQRSKIFSNMVKEIIVAVKTGGGPDPLTNPRLRVAIQNARGANMPKDNIDRAINKGNCDVSNYTTIVYEATWKYGVQFVITCMTDNPNRSAADVRAVLNRNNAKLGTSGSVMFNFEYKSYFIVDKKDIADVEVFVFDNISNGMQDIYEYDDATYCIICDMQSFGIIQHLLEKEKINIINAGLRYYPISTADLKEEEDFASVENIVDALEELDDVQNVATNI